MPVIITMKVDKAKIEKAIGKQLGQSRVLKAQANKVFFGIFDRSKRLMLQEFDRHPVTQEIKEGPTAYNDSETLNGYGNLFSFIGFEEGSDPTELLRAILYADTTYNQTQYKNGQWLFRVKIPARSVIKDATEMPWEQGNSWAEGIEEGISGLSHYMYKHWDNGLSKEGFQLPWENQSYLEFHPRMYLTEILENFRKDLKDKR